MRLLLEKYRVRCRLTPMQSLIFCDLEPSERSHVERILIDHGVKLAPELSPVRRLAIACPAFPTCGLSITESERVMPEVLTQLDAVLGRLGMPQERIATHMTGCPNGCARPYTPDIGFVGKTLGKYTIYVGGNLTGSRLAFIYKDLVPFDDLIPALVPLLTQFKNGRQNGESFGDFCQRLGKEAVGALGESGCPRERMTSQVSTAKPASQRQGRTWESLLEALRRDRAKIAEGRRTKSHRTAAREKPAHRPRADRPADRCRQLVLRVRPVLRLGHVRRLGAGPRGQRDLRCRRRRGPAVHARRQRRDGEGRLVLPDDGQEGAPGAADRAWSIGCR